MNKTLISFKTAGASSTGSLGLAVFLCAGFTHAATFPIGVNFSEGGAQDLGAAEIAGAPTFEHANWNNLGRWGNPLALKDSTGATTPVTIKWDSTAFYRNNANEALGGNHKLMKGYLDSNGTAITAPFDGVFGNSDDKPTVLLTGLNAWMTSKGITSFSIVIYSDSDVAGQRGAKVWLSRANPASPVNGDPGLGPNITGVVEILDEANWGTTPNFVKVTGSSGVGNYTVFSGVNEDAIYIRLDEGGAVPWRCPLNAFQIIGTDAPVLSDQDGDGMPDSWESNFGLDPLDNGSVNVINGPAGDPDNDGRTNLQEYNGGVNSTNPRLADTDGDGLSDGQEATLGTNPLSADTDSDGLPDKWEVDNQLSPTDAGTVNTVNGPNGDPDNDGLTNLQEFTRKTNPRNADTDGDGYSDLVEDASGNWAGVSSPGTSPILADSDHDGIPDKLENPDATYVPGVTSGTDPNLADSDWDGDSDYWEFALGTDPTLDTSTLPKVTFPNSGFEQPDAAGAFLNVVPTGWTMVNGVEVNDVFVESIGAVGILGGEGAQYAGMQEIGAYIHQNTGVAFSPNTTYLIDISGAFRGGFATGAFEFGFFSSNSVGTPVKGFPGRFDIAGTLTNSGNPDADNVSNVFRDASAVSRIGSGSLARPFSFVTGATPPAGNIVVYVKHVSGGRVMFDNVRIYAVPNSLDSDNDGLPDAWEVANKLDPKDNGSVNVRNGPNGDPDGDGLTNAQELANATSPLVSDTDGDGFSDGAEVAAGTSPTDATSFPLPGTLRVASSGFNGAAFEVTAADMVATKTYRLARSTELSSFVPVGGNVTGVTTHKFTDPAPPTGKAFYRVEEVTP